MTKTPQEALEWTFLGQRPYIEIWEMQRSLRQKRIQGEIADRLLLLEHPATITLGRLRGEESLRRSVEQLEEEGITVIRSDRGGDATLHAPGQIVGYLIVDLGKRGMGLPLFVETIAGALASVLASFGIQASYDPKFPGLWIGKDKIAAFGFHLLQGVTMHGFAFNLATDLRLFDRIVPCGLQDKGVTSLARACRERGDLLALPTVAALAPGLAEAIAGGLGLSCIARPLP